MQKFCNSASHRWKQLARRKNSAKRLIKAPKVHVCDSGLAATLADLHPDDWNAKRDRFGHLLESFALQQLVAQAGWTDPDLRFWHYRDKDKVEVDCVVTRGRKVWGIEVKAAATVNPPMGRDFTGWRNRREATLKRALFSMTGMPWFRWENRGSLPSLFRDCGNVEGSCAIHGYFPDPMSAESLVTVALSDTHGLHAAMKHDIPQGDVFIHAGDFCGRGLVEEVVEFAHWMGSLPHQHKLVIPGNHDRPVEESEQICRDVFRERGIRLLIGETVKIEGFRFFGSPYTPTFLNWHFMRDRGPAIRAEWEAIPDKTDVVITHGPAYGHGDLTLPWKGEPPRHVGCFELLARLRSVRPSYHVFGHIHEGYGVTNSDEIPETTFLNASVCTEHYRPSNQPHAFTLQR